MRRLVFVLAFALAGFSAQARDVTQNPTKDPLAFIKAIYAAYTEQVPRPSLTDDFYSRRMQGLLDADKKATPAGDSGTIDWDVFVDGNDWTLTKLRVTLVSRADRRAQVRAVFLNHKKPRDMLFDLVRERGRWLIDDVREMQPGGRWTMSKILTHAPDAFPDEKLKKAPDATPGENPDKK
jgi:Protein of unknown function (DUF3828)